MSRASGPFSTTLMVGGTNPTTTMDEAMKSCKWGIIVLSPKFIESKWCMKELGMFLERGNILPVSLGLSVVECDANRIAGKVGPVWEVHGGELWKKCKMEEADWRSLVDGVSKKAVVVKSEDSNGYWGHLINEIVVNLAKKLRRQVVESRVARSIVTLPYLRNRDFLGRDKELADLKTALLKPQSRVSISAMGGMGKTQVALEYVYRHLNEYWKVLWVDAGTNSLLTNYLGLAEDLGVTLGKEKGTKLSENDRRGGKEVAVIREALERLRVPCLLIFDDVADADQLSELLPKIGECRVLVTTRFNLVSNYHNIPLQRLAPTDGITLVRGRPHIGPADFEEGLQTLAERFDYLTLALSVCSAWLRESRLEPAALLQRLDDKEVASAFGGRKADSILKTNPDLVTLFQASIEQIKRIKGTTTGRMGERIVWLGGWFAGVPIRVDLLTFEALVNNIDSPDEGSFGLCGLLGLCRRGGNQDEIRGAGGEIEAAVDELVNFNLADRGARGGLQREGQAQCVVFHTVQRSFGRVKGGLEYARAMVKSLVEKGNAVSDTEHFQHACDLAFSMKDSQKVLLDARDRRGAVSLLLLPLVSHNRQKGLYFKARNTISSANIDGMPDELQWRYLNSWASSLGDCGQYAEALPLCKCALRISEKALGPEHPEVAATLNNMALLLDSQGKYFDLLPLYERALRISEKALGPGHPSVAATLNNMALLLQMQGKYVDSLPLYERALRIKEKALGREHPSVAATLDGMALLLQRQGKYAEALPLYERALRIKEKALGREHPSVAATLNGMALLLQRQGKYAEALPLYERALRIKEKALGPEHPEVAATLDGMAVLLQSQGKYAEARPLYERALRIKEKALGPEHLSVATTLDGMAVLLQRQGMYGGALPLYERALRIEEKALGPEHLSVATTLKGMALLLQRQGKYKEALPLYERALRIKEKALGREHPSVATTLNNMALLLQSQGKYGEALPLYERAIAIGETALGAEHV
jgi:tetratricopeptide (TPR) repeat protein